MRSRTVAGRGCWLGSWCAALGWSRLESRHVTPRQALRVPIIEVLAIQPDLATCWPVPRHACTLLINATAWSRSWLRSWCWCWLRLGSWLWSWQGLWSRTRDIGDNVNINARQKHLVGVFAHPQPPQRHKPGRHVGWQLHYLRVVLATFAMLTTTGGWATPIFVNIDPICERAAHKALLILNLRVWAVAPTSLSVVVCI